MREYISKEDAIKAMDKVIYEASNVQEARAMIKIKSVIYDQNVIKLQPVKHGRCVIDNEGYERCSVCNEHETNMTYFTFCPHCGARMDGDTE